MRTLREILSDVKRLAVEYYGATGKPLGVTGEIAEFEAAEKLGLELAPARTEGYDAIGSDSRQIQIKARRLKERLRAGRMSKIDINKPFDTVLLVLLGEDYEPLEIWEAGREAVVARITAPGSKARNERYQLGVSQFLSIAERVWPVAD